MYSVTVSLPPDTSANRSENGTTTPDLTVLSGGVKCARSSDLLPGPRSAGGEHAARARSRRDAGAMLRTRREFDTSALPAGTWISSNP